MKLTKEICRELLNLPPAPPETGGLIGAKDNIGIKIYKDEIGTARKYSYSPNTDLLNKTIEKWANEDISLLGIYHTHIENGFELSKQDKEYITNIMRSIGNIFSSLYFPIVIPPDTIIAYKATFIDNTVNITREKILLHKGD